MVFVIYSDDFLEHHTGKFHPERPERLTAIVKALKSFSRNDKLQWYSPILVQDQYLSLLRLLVEIHSPSYIEKVSKIANSGGGYLDSDTPVSAKSFDVALLAVSAWIDGVDLVLKNDRPAFVLARPPGHHAESGKGMGFCLFSNASIAAHYALKQPGVNRVAILDWDVHHGNGTQQIVQNNRGIVYCSLHQSPCFPETGFSDEHGLFNNVLNIPIRPGSKIRVYKQFFRQKVIPFLSSFRPDLLIVSAGYDANHNDPLADVSLQPKDYSIFAKYCCQITPKILFGLEGGYDLSSLSQSVLATIEIFL